MMSLAKSIKEQTAQHLELLGHALHMSRDILNDLSSDKEVDVDQLAATIDNRSRLIDVIAVSQDKIEHAINNLSTDEIDSVLVHQLTQWQKSVDELINEVEKIDVQIIDCLENEKNDTTAKIARIFKFKQSFKGYNLNDVRR